MRDEPTARVLAAITASPGITMDQLASLVKRRRDTVKPYVRKLIQLGVVRVEGQPGPKPYRYFAVKIEAAERRW